jgi:hypothetical protein
VLLVTEEIFVIHAKNLMDLGTLEKTLINALNVFHLVKMPLDYQELLLRLLFT